MASIFMGSGIACAEGLLLETRLSKPSIVLQIKGGGRARAVGAGTD